MVLWYETFRPKLENVLSLLEQMRLTGVFLLI